MNNVQSLYKQIKLNSVHIAKHALTHTCSVIAVIEILGFLCDFNMVFPDDFTFIKRLLVSVVLVFNIWLVLFAIESIVVLATKQVTVIDAGSGHYVYVEYGDLFEERDERNNVVITANRCFDTIVDDDLISATTIHGKAVQRICANGYTAQELNASLQADLNDKQQIQPEKVLLRPEKRLGNLQRYPVGTIAEFRKTAADKTTYFFMGMSAFNSGLHPETTDEEYALAIQRLLKYCRQRSQRFPIYMPVIGTNGLDNKKSERALLEYMVNVFRFNNHLINTDIHIVVYSERRNEVSIQGL